MLFISSVLIFLGGNLGIECAKLPREPQYQPDFDCKSEEVVVARVKYLAQEKAYSEYNQIIPRTDSHFLRIVNYIVNYHSNIEGIENTKLVEEDLEKLDPAVVIFHEVSKDSLEDIGFKKMLENFGHHHMQMITSETSDISSMIVSKYPLERIGQETFGELGKILATKVRVNGEEIAIIGASFCYEILTRQYLARIIKFLDGNIFGKYSKYVFGVSTLLPDVREGFQVKELNESFIAKEVSPPKYTDQWGDTGDAIFVSEELVKGLLGSYVFHTTSTANTPILVDIEISEKSEKST